MYGSTMHEQFLLSALAQAWLGRGICSPNPSVGAVAVQNDMIIAQAWHHGAGTPHAEQLLLEQFPKNTPGVTIYVTLEPCNHWGRTSPCVDAIIQHGIQRVVYAYHDLNPTVVDNNTPLLLKSKGIEVVHQPLFDIDRFYQSYRHWCLTKKPWVSVKIAQTFDGKCAAKNNKRVNLSNELCAEFTHRQRLHSDIILTTARTVNLDDPLLNVRIPGINVAKPVAIIDTRSTLNPQAKVLTTAKHCHIYYGTHVPVNQYPNCFYHEMGMDAGQLDLNAVMLHLGSLGYHDVWVEAGGELFSALHRAHLVNRSYIYLVPSTLGNAATSVYKDINPFENAHSIAWRVMDNNMIAILDWQEG